MANIIDIDEVIKKCEALADSEYQKNVSKGVPTEWQIIGVKTPVIREYAKEFPGSVKTEEDFKDLLVFIDEAFEKKIIEPLSLGLSIIDKRKKFYNRSMLDHVKRWAPEIADWAVCDGIGMIITSHMLLNDIINIQDLQFLKNHENLFARRLYIVSFLQVLRKGTGNFDRCLEELADFVDDHEKYIYKAVSWMLRSGVKSHPDKIVKFLNTYRDRLHSSVVREVERKLTTGRKSG